MVGILNSGLSILGTNPIILVSLLGQLIPGTGTSPTSPTTSPTKRWPFQRSGITRKLEAKPEAVLSPTLPMPFFFVKPPSRFDRLVSHGFFDDPRKKRPRSPSTPSLRAQ